jgi:flagellar motor protein MotB
MRKLHLEEIARQADTIASNATAQGRAQNRRVEVTLAGQTPP